MQTNAWLIEAGQDQEITHLITTEFAGPLRKQQGRNLDNHFTDQHRRSDLMLVSPGLAGPRGRQVYPTENGFRRGVEGCPDPSLLLDARSSRSPRGTGSELRAALVSTVHGERGSATGDVAASRVDLTAMPAIGVWPSPPEERSAR